MFSSSLFCGITSVGRVVVAHQMKNAHTVHDKEHRESDAYQGEEYFVSNSDALSGGVLIQLVQSGRAVDYETWILQSQEENQQHQENDDQRNVDGNHDWFELGEAARAARSHCKVVDFSPVKRSVRFTCEPEAGYIPSHDDHGVDGTEQQRWQFREYHVSWSRCLQDTEGQ